MNSEENENHSRMCVSVFIKSEQYADINLNAEHGMLGPGSHKNLHEMFSDANHVNRKTMNLLREGIHLEKQHHLKSEKRKTEEEFASKSSKYTKYNTKQQNRTTSQIGSQRGDAWNT